MLSAQLRGAAVRVDSVSEGDRADALIWTPCCSPAGLRPWVEVCQEWDRIPCIAVVSLVLSKLGP